MKREVILREMPSPKLDAAVPILLSDETMEQRKSSVLIRMKQQGYDVLMIYCDIEHGNNFEYLTGFKTRFEEGLLILQRDGKAFLIVGNENVKLAARSRIPGETLHCPFFSLPNQPMDGEVPLTELLKKTKIHEAKQIGIVGWKNFTSGTADNTRLFDIPHYIVEAVKTVCDGDVRNATDLFIGDKGARTVNNANEIAHYEYGSALASDGVLRVLNALEPGKSELELGTLLHAHGQTPNVVSICASGPRYGKANLYPTANSVKVGDTFSVTCGYKGGLASRAAYIVQNEEELPETQKDYLDKVAKPYFCAVAAWLENLRIGMRGGEMWTLVNEVLPQRQYGWTLCPGHLTADEEWMSSPIYKGSEETIQSGMLLQLDIIPSVSGYAGVGCENGVALADESLRTTIQAEYPELWERIVSRREYIQNNIGIDLPEEVLPLSSGVAYLRPYLLAKEKAFAIER